MSADERPGIRHAPNRSGRVSPAFRDLLSRYGASTELLTKVSEVTAPVADHHASEEQNPAPAREEGSTYQYLVAIDIVGYGKHSSAEQVRARHRLQRVVDDALAAIPINSASLQHVDRGDGMLIVLPGSVNIANTAGSLIRELDYGLRALPPLSERLRLRLAIGGGFVRQVGIEVIGSTVVSTFRLLAAPALTEVLMRAPEADIAVIFSDVIFQSDVRHDYRGVDSATFAPVDVTVTESHLRAWIHVPGYAYPPGMTPLKAEPGALPTATDQFAVTGDAGEGRAWRKARVHGAAGSTPVVEVGMVAAYVIAWAVRKARRAAGQVDETVDAAIDVGADRLYEVVLANLGEVAADLIEEATGDSGQVSELTRQRVELAVAAAARRDEAFGRTVTDLLGQVRSAEQRSGAQALARTGSTAFTREASPHVGGDAVGEAGK